MATVRKALSILGYSPNTIDGIDSLVNTVKAATTSFGYDIGSPLESTQEGGTLGRTLRAILETYQNTPAASLDL